MSAPFTLQEAAGELGVHYMTAYRYVRLGLLDADKVGGIWQVSDEAIAAFLSREGNGPVKPGGAAPWAERFEVRLVDGDAQGAWSVVEAAMTAGADARSIYLEMIVPAMTRIGDRWAIGDIDVAVEHEATVIVSRVIGRLGPRFVRRGRSRGDLVIGAPLGEGHSLSTAIVSDLLRLSGWDVCDLGANTPSVSFLHAARRVPQLRGVGISVTYPDFLAALREVCAVLKQEFPDVPLVVGGRAILSSDHARWLGADHLADDVDDMHEYLTR